MKCPHSTHDTPERCSQCLGIAPRRVDQHGAELTIDGAPVRSIAQPEVPAADYYRRGGRRGGPAKARKHAEAAAQPSAESRPSDVAADETGDSEEKLE